MKKNIILLLAIVTLHRGFAQEEGVTLDLLKAASSPAANILGFAVSDIERPTDLSSLMLSLQSASNTFNALPSNYAIDLAPYFLFSKKTFTTTDLNNTDFGSVFRQTFIISLGIRNVDSVLDNFKAENTYAGIGFKFSIIRPKYIEEDAAILESIHANARAVNLANQKAIQEYKKYQDPQVRYLDERRREILRTHTVDQILAMQEDSTSELKALDRQLSFLMQNLTQKDSAEYKQQLLDKIQQDAAKFTATRQGFSMEISGGLGSEFINKQFNNARLFNAGIWTSLGYTCKDLTVLGLLRWLHNPDRIFAKDNMPNQIADISTFDGGFRLMYAPKATRFTASLETIYRSILSTETIDPSWRLIFNADYALFKNQKLTFSFGRNFDGTLSRDGNLVAALTFLAGFGNKR